MRILAIPLTLGALLLALLLGGPVAERWRDRNAHQRTIETIQAQDYAYQTAATQQARALGSNALQLFLLLGIAGAGAVAFDMYRQRRAPIVRVNGMPIARHAITAEDQQLVAILAERIRLSGIAAIEEAKRPMVPASLSYAPHVTTVDAEPAPAAPALLTDTAPAVDVVMPRDRWLRWLDEQPHALLGGRTKAGKTTLATAILAQRLRASEQVFIIDPHSSGWMGLPTAGSAANNGELVRALGAVLAEYIARMQARDAHKRTTGQELPHDFWPRLTVLIDECNSIADEYKAQWTTVVKQLASGSRKVGISLLCLAQSALVEDLGISGGMRANFARVALDDATVQAMIDSERDKGRKEALRAALRGIERPAAAQIGPQVWLLDRSDVSAGSAPSGARERVWQGWNFDQGRRAAIGTAETLKDKVSAYETPETPETEFQINPEIAEIVRRLRNEGKSKTQVIYLVWNAKPGGSKGFRDASAAYDAIVAA